MPDPMTPEEAKDKVCPFMSSKDDRVGGIAGECSLWGWIDGPDGQFGSLPIDRKVLPSVTDRPEGPGWILQNGVRTWARYEVIGPRRGQCQAGTAG